jgi:uncharacterized protein YaaQ
MYINYFCICALFTGGFLSDAGWFAESEKVLLACKRLCQSAEPVVKYGRKLLECCHKYVSFTVEITVYYSLFLVESIEAISFLSMKYSHFEVLNTKRRQ